MAALKPDDRDLTDYGTFKPMWQILAREVLPALLERVQFPINSDEPESDEISDAWEEPF